MKLALLAAESKSTR